MDKIKTLADLLIEKADELGWFVRAYGDEWELEKWSPAGEDFIFTIDSANPVAEVVRYYQDFDPEEHCMMWIAAKQNGGRSDIPNVWTLVHDAEDIDKMLEELAEALENVKNLWDDNEQEAE